MRRRLLALVIAFASLGTIGASAAKAATDSPTRQPWLCVGEKDIQKSLHHTQRSTTARYLHATQQHIAEALAILPRLSPPAEQQKATGTDGGLVVSVLCNLIRAGAVSNGYAYGFYSFFGGYCRDNTVLFNSTGRGYVNCNQIGPSGSNYTTNP